MSKPNADAPAAAPRPAPAPAAPRRAAPPAAQRATVQIIDGQLVVAEPPPPPAPPAPEAAQDDEGPVVEVSETGEPGATSASFTSRRHTERWGIEETRRFYHALQRFGTDFTLMKSEFPGRSQRQLKNKYKKEHKRQFERRRGLLLGLFERTTTPAVRRSKNRRKRASARREVGRRRRGSVAAPPRGAT